MSSPVSQNLRIALCIASVLFPFGCGDSTAPPAGTAFVVTADESPVAGDQIIVKAQLADAQGNPVRLSGRLVVWVTNYGRLGITASVTGDDGIASTVLTTDTLAGRQHRVGAIDNQHGVSGISPPINTVAGLPVSYKVIPSVATPEVGSSVSISAQLGDRYHNATKIAGRVVSWSEVVPGDQPTGASFSSPTSTTDADGIATVNFTIGTGSGWPYQVSVRDDHDASGVSDYFLSRPGAIAAYSVYPAVIDPPAGAAVPVYAQAADIYGNPTAVVDRQVQWSMTGSGGSLNTTTSQTDGGGTATVILTTSAAPGATYTVSASDASGKVGTSPSFTTTQQVALASISIGLGTATTCGTATDGRAWCWGANDAGQLGNGNRVERAFPGKVAGNYTMTSLSAAEFHTCGIAGGVVLCWGDNQFGELGDNTLVLHPVPTAINSSLTFISVSAGSRHTCAIATGGDAYCWGLSAGGRLGDGSQASGSSNSPVKVAGGLSFVAVSAGVDHTCAITTGGDAYCWGSNGVGKLGDGSVLPAFTPRAVSGGLKFTSISLGETHTCGIAGGKAYCWGDPTHGQLGGGSPLTMKNTPSLVAGGLTFVAISAGAFHTCGIATDATAWCWGDNTTGELGDPAIPSNVPYKSVPTAVSGGLSFNSIAVGGGLIGGDYYYYYYGQPGGHSCGVTTAGVAYCWGSNNRGELGSGPSMTLSRAPVRVSGQP